MLSSSRSSLSLEAIYRVSPATQNKAVVPSSCYHHRPRYWSVTIGYSACAASEESGRLDRRTNRHLLRISISRSRRGASEKPDVSTTYVPHPRRGRQAPPCRPP
ncbi:hypothetical protein MRX96_016837 [Rhipicephalus microplus]